VVLIISEVLNQVPRGRIGALGGPDPPHGPLFGDLCSKVLSVPFGK